MRVFIAGGSGVIGRRIVDRLAVRGDSVVILSRRADALRRDPAWRMRRIVQGDPTKPGGWEQEVDGCDAVINLTGASIFARRWNAEYKREIRDSRIRSTEGIVQAIAGAALKPRVLVQGSAAGYYGRHGDEELTESSPAGNDFLATLCRDWEAAAAPATGLDVRVAVIRIGIVLAKGDGALKIIAPIFKWLPGGAAPIGSGDKPFGLGRGMQWFSWIHIDDIVGIFLTALDNPSASGPINGTAPNPVRNVDFSRALAKALRRPMLPFGPPDALLHLSLGEVAEDITKGQRVLPAKALELGYRFVHPELVGALDAIFPGAKSRRVQAVEPVQAAP